MFSPRGHSKPTCIEVRVVSMRVAVSVLRAKGRLRARAPRAPLCRMPRAARAILVVALLALPPATATAETLPEALVRTYQDSQDRGAMLATLDELRGKK